MLKVQTVKKQLESFFKTNQYRYMYMNNKIKTLSLPVYLLGLNIISDENKEIAKITTMVSIFPSSHTICFECLNLYHADEQESSEVLRKVNLVNNFSFPGTFTLKKDGSVTYCCYVDYTHSSKIHNDVIMSVIDSIPPAYFIFSDIIKDDKELEY